MALTTPILYTQVAFDASNAQTFKFNVIGGDQVTGSTIVIKDNATLSQVYTTTVTSYAYSITVPAGSLTNGKYYQAYITTHNAAGETSEPSNTIQFYCYTTPSFEFSNLPSTHILNNASYIFSVTYNQEQKEPLNAYRFDLYDNTGILLSTSSTKYTSTTSVPITVSWAFSGFEDKTIYKIQCTGTTSEGTIVDTGLITITIQYSGVRSYSNLYLTNNCNDGNITIESNVLAIDGEANPANPTYIDDKEIDLRADGSYVKWQQGYQLPNDYTMRIWGRAFNANTEVSGDPNNLLELMNADGDIVYVSYWEDATNAWYEMKVKDIGSTWAYVIKSTTIPKPTDNDYIFMWLRCDGGLYDLKIENLGADWNEEAAGT